MARSSSERFGAEKEQTPGDPMVPFRYLTPLFFLALLALGEWLGGGWTFLAAGATPLCIAGLDAAFGTDDTGSPGAPIARWLPRIYIVLQLVANAVAAALVASPATSLLETIGLILSAGITTGVFGFLAAHEMIHSPESPERALGAFFLASVFYMHFRIAHIYGHHRRAATADDPATARLGEGLYSFLPRTIAGQFAEAWTFEVRRRRRSGRPAFGLGNRMIVYVAIEALLLLAIALVSLRALVFLAAVAAIAVVLLESFNYVAHYGLRRRILADGRPERLTPSHSWNSARRMNNAALFNMGRHSDHHRAMTRSYESLRPLAGDARLPSGYAAALLTAFVPPLWKRVMDPRARALSLGEQSG